jgi:hypothetical protein
LGRPFNPLLGETYELVRPDKGLRFLSEKCCHHPPLLAAWAEDTDGLWQYQAYSGAKEKFYGRTLEFSAVGSSTLRFQKFKDVYRWNRPSTYIRNLMMGEKYIEFVGEITIESESARIELEFKEGGGGMWGSSRNKVQGKVFDAQDKLVTELTGRWDEGLARSQGGKGDFHMIWQVDPNVVGGASAARHEMIPKLFSRSLAIWLHAMDCRAKRNHWSVVSLSGTRRNLQMAADDIKDVLPPTDTRLRPDQRAFEEGRLEEAEQMKAILEQRQRERRAELEEKQLVPRFFTKDSTGEWVYKGGYWEARQSKKWNDRERFVLALALLTEFPSELAIFGGV